jgi:sec-independent protein translocase protein TatA
MFGLGAQELILVLLILLVLFGGTKLPKLARALGASISEFRHGLKGQSDTPLPPAERSHDDSAT